MQKVILIFALLALGAFASIPINTEELKSLWSSWKMYNGKSYAAAEEKARFAIFVENYKKVIEFNAAHETVKLAMNKFADLTATEFTTLHTGFVPSNDVSELKIKTFDTVNIPDTVDWRSQGAVTAIKDQAQCGSCWAFATVGALESWHYITKQILLSFSEQQLVDCDTGSLGCMGGDPVGALTYTAQNGLELGLTYPYTAADGKCAFVKTLAVSVNTDSSRVTPRDSDALKAALVVQPVSVAIEADQGVFQLYSSGVIGDGCGAQLDHAVLAVGYATVGTEDAFIIKNSWGVGWGQQGYVYLSTDGSLNGGAGACGILSQPVVPTD